MTYLLATVLLASSVTVPVDEPVALLVFGRTNGPRTEADTCQRQYAEVVSLHQAGFPVYYADIDKPDGAPWIEPLGITMVPWHVLVIDGKAAEFSPGYKSAWYMSDWYQRAVAVPPGPPLSTNVARERAERRGEAPPQSTPPVFFPGRAGPDVGKVDKEPKGDLPSKSRVPAGLSETDPPRAETDSPASAVGVGSSKKNGRPQQWGRFGGG